MNDRSLQYGYRISALDVASELRLEGAIPLTAVPEHPEVRIRLNPSVPAELDDATLIGPNWQLTDSAMRLEAPRIATFLMRDGESIDVALADGADEADAGVFLTGSAFGILLHQRKRLVLHASAVAVDGRAMVFCGPSGAGKSTLAAALVAAGYPLISDDVTAIEMRDGAMIVHPDGRKLKLWQDAIQGLDLEETRGGAVRRALEKYYVEPPHRHPHPTPLGAIYILGEDRPPHAFGIERPVLPDAARLLRGHAYRPRIVRAMKQQPDYLNAAVAISAMGAIHQLFRPKQFTRLDEVVDLLRRHWEGARG